MNAIYLRVSTLKQGASGLGIEAQRAAIQAAGIVGKEFEEHESGKNPERPILAEAIAYVKKTGGILYIAKLDRLARDVEFIFRLRRELAGGGTRFEALDLPEFNTLTLGIFASFAQFEGERISQRYKEARAQRVLKRGGEWATGDIRRFGEKKGSEANRSKALARKKQVFATAQLLREKGLTLDKIAERLNELGYQTPAQLSVRSKFKSGGGWSKALVSRLFKSFEVAIK